MNIMRGWTGLCVALMATGCALETSEEPTSSAASAIQGFDEGTQLSFAVDVEVGSCDGAGAWVSHHATLTTTGSVDSAVITVEGEQVYTVHPRDFEHHGRVKTYEHTETSWYPSGIYTEELCATQSGAHGREAKRACTEVRFTVCLPQVELIAPVRELAPR